MNEELTSNNIENNDRTLNTKESDYSDLISILKEISNTITLLEKEISI